MDLRIRPRRNRKSDTIRQMVAENRIHLSDLMYPLFVTNGVKIQDEIKSMPGIFRLSPDNLFSEITKCIDLGINAFALFPHYSENDKDPFAKESVNKEGLYLKTINDIKKQFPQIVLMTDVAMDPYSSDGHDGLFKNGIVLNDETLPILANMAVCQAEAGADIVGPSDMMDGRVGYIRDALDKRGFSNVSIMSYTAKYASAYYGPFRDALDSAPRAGDKKTYQMDPSNKKEALLEARLDVDEGADFIMVKPAMPYLDVIHLLSTNCTLPVAAYQVSGEYAQICAAAHLGWLDKEKVIFESLIGIKRAGAKIILTYFAKEFAYYLHKTK